MTGIFGLYSLASIILPCLVYHIILISKAHRAGQRCEAVHFIWVYIFLIYIWMVFEVTGIGLLGDILRTDTNLFLGGRNFIPFDSIGIGYLLNIIMFMPLGFLLPFIWQDCRKLGKTVLTGAAFTMMIEITQLFNYRATDIDDLTANTLGALLGYMIWKAFVSLFGTHLKAKAAGKHEAVIHILLALGGTFFLYNPYPLLRMFI